MRIGEIKNIIKRVIDDNSMIKIDNEAAYGSQAYQINNFADLVQALDILTNQKWNDADFVPVQQIISAYERSSNQVLLTVDEFNQLNSYIGTINPKIPLYYLTLDSLTEDQNEKTINIKLPSDINALSELTTINKRLDDIFKLFNVDGEFEFKGFDKGSDWYEMVAVGILSYHFVLACLKIAQEYLKTKTEYFKSQEARISYEATLKENEVFSEEGFKLFQKKWLEIFIEKEIKSAIEKIGKNGQTDAELQTHLVAATTKLVKELNEGTEFHLSLNPPSYVKEEAGRLEIDYKKIKASNPQKEEKPKSLEAPELKENEK